MATDEGNDCPLPSWESQDVISRKVNVKSGGKVMAVVREQYLRSDLSCLSEICFEESCKSSRSRNLLGSGMTHYLIPFIDVAGHYMDVLEIEDLRGIIFLHTVVNVVKFARGSLFDRICKVVKDPAKQSVFFPNEFFKQTAAVRNDGETLKSWRGRLVHEAAVWYYEHLGGQKPIVIVSEDEEFIKSHENGHFEVFVLKLGDYLKKFWPHVEKAHTVYESLNLAHKELLQSNRQGLMAVGKKDTGYEDHLRPEAVENGVKSGNLYVGTIFVNKYHSTKEAVVIPRSTKGTEKSKVGSLDEILVSGNVERNRAVHGDIVAVQLLPKSLWKSKINRLAKSNEKDDEEKWDKRADVCPTGKVVAVVTRRWKAYSASFTKKSAAVSMGQQRILVCPYDRRIPKVRIVTSQASSFIGKRIVIRIDNWPSNSQYPNGHFVRTLGDIGDLDAELDAILVENDIADCTGPFSQGILSEMPKFDSEWKPDPKEVEKRKDLRDIMIMSIDPKGCTDVDDALSVRILSNGKIELGVHIADVTHFVTPNSFTDQEAQRRATTVYLADRRFEMLPSLLSSNVCSLLGSVDRYAVSVIWELDGKNYNVTNVWYGRTIIRSSYKMTYEAAQAVIDGETEENLRYEIPELALLSEEDLSANFKVLRTTLLLLSRVAKKVQDNREKDGALRLESGSEVQFEFEKSSLETIKPKQHLAIHETVAECMIFANHWVAKKISKTFPHQSILRRHPAPKNDSFAELKSCAKSKGWDLDVWSNKVLAESLDKCIDPTDPNVNFLLRSLATHAMEQAVYFSTGSMPKDKWEHYGLALRHYTHFTSPIRRYADVIVHRLLILAVSREDWWDGEGGKQEHLPLTNSELSELCDHVNDRNKAAQMAQRQSSLLFQTLFFQGREPDDPKCIVDAVVFGIRSNGFIVYVPCYALKGPVYMQQGEEEVLFLHKKQGPVWKDGKIEAGEHEIRVLTRDGTNKQTYRLFDHVMVTIQLKGTDEHARTLAFYLLGRRPASKSSASAPPTLDKGEVNFLREIKRLKELETQSDDSVDMETEVPPSKKKRQGGVSMYEFFQEMKTMGETVSKID